jgi:hypothetical protein
MELYMKKVLLAAISLLLALSMCSCSFIEQTWNGIKEFLGIEAEEESEEEVAINLFGDGVLCVKKDGKYGYVNMDGEYVVAAKYDSAFPFFGGSAIVSSIESGNGLIDKDGNVVVELGELNYTPSSLYPLMGYLAGVKLDTSLTVSSHKLSYKNGFMNEEGEIVINSRYDKAFPFQKDVGLARVVVDGKYGFINREGEFAVEAIYDYLGYFYEGRAVAKKDGK